MKIIKIQINVTLYFLHSATLVEHIHFRNISNVIIEKQTMFINRFLKAILRNLCIILAITHILNLLYVYIMISILKNLILTIR